MDEITDADGVEVKGLGALAEEVRQAKQDLESAEAEERAASSNTTSARNRFNKVTRAFDAEVERLRKEAPRSTDWANKAQERRWRDGITA